MTYPYASGYRPYISQYPSAQESYVAFDLSGKDVDTQCTLHRIGEKVFDILQKKGSLELKSTSSNFCFTDLKYATHTVSYSAIGNIIDWLANEKTMNVKEECYIARGLNEQLLQPNEKPSYRSSDLSSIHLKV